MARRLRPDEERLWRRVASLTRPLDGRHPTPPVADAAPVNEPEAAPQKAAPAPVAWQPPPFRIGEASADAAPVPSRGRAPPRLDRRTERDLSRGRRAPEATIDLHGMTLAQAHASLRRFVLASFAMRRRLVLVITGKGRGDDDARGVLRRQVPDWLAAPPLGGIVRDVLPAHRSHGGGGAFYVMLRRG